MKIANSKSLEDCGLSWKYLILFLIAIFQKYFYSFSWSKFKNLMHQFFLLIKSNIFICDLAKNLFFKNSIKIVLMTALNFNEKSFYVPIKSIEIYFRVKTFLNCFWMKIHIFWRNKWKISMRQLEFLFMG